MERKTRQIVGIVLVLVGLGVGVWGVGWLQGDAENCKSYAIVVHEEDSSLTDRPVVDYENLTTDQQRLFRQALESESNSIMASHGFGPQRVRYEGRTYGVATAGGHPCRSALSRVYPLVAGGGLVVGGLVVLYRTRP